MSNLPGGRQPAFCSRQDARSSVRERVGPVLGPGLGAWLEKMGLGCHLAGECSFRHPVSHRRRGVPERPSVAGSRRRISVHGLPCCRDMVCPQALVSTEIARGCLPRLCISGALLIGVIDHPGCRCRHSLTRSVRLGPREHAYRPGRTRGASHALLLACSSGEVLCHYLDSRT